MKITRYIIRSILKANDGYKFEKELIDHNSSVFNKKLINAKDYDKANIIFNEFTNGNLIISKDCEKLIKNILKIETEIYCLVRDFFLNLIDCGKYGHQEQEVIQELIGANPDFYEEIINIQNMCIKDNLKVKQVDPTKIGLGNKDIYEYINNEDNDNIYEYINDHVNVSIAELAAVKYLNNQLEITLKLRTIFKERGNTYQLKIKGPHEF